MSELIQKLTGNKAETLLQKSLEEGIITEEEVSWDSLSYAEAAYHLRHVGTSSARKYLADRLDLAETLWMEGDENNLNYDELFFLVGAKALDKLERENCQPTSRLLEPHLEGLTEWESSIETVVDEKSLRVVAVYYTDEEDEKLAAEDGWDSVNWEKKFSHYTIED